MKTKKMEIISPFFSLNIGLFYIEHVNLPIKIKD